VHGSLGIDVFKGEDILILVNFFRRNLAADNAAKKAVAAGISHRSVTTQQQNNNI
jgi:hypothetical protein